MSLWYKKRGWVAFTGVSQYGSVHSSGDYPYLEFDQDGIRGDGNYGRTRRLSAAPYSPVARHLGYHNDDLCENDRQFVATSVEQIKNFVVQAGMAGKSEVLTPMLVQEVAECLAVNLVVEGIEHFSQLPAGTLLSFENPESEADPGKGVILEISGPGCALTVRQFADVVLTRNVVGLKPPSDLSVSWCGVVGRVKMGGNVYRKRFVDVWVPGPSIIEEIVFQPGFEPLRLS